MRTPFDGHVRRKRLTVVVRDLLPPWPSIGDNVGVLLDGVTAVPGRVIQRLAMDAFRIELPDEPLP